MSRNRSAATGGCIYDRCYFYIVPYYFKQCTDLPVPVSDSRHKCRKRSGIPSACRSAPKQQHILPYIPQDTFLCRFIRRPDRRLSPLGRSVSLESAGILPHGIGSPLDHALRPPSAARRQSACFSAFFMKQPFPCGCFCSPHGQAYCSMHRLFPLPLRESPCLRACRFMRFLLFLQYIL